MRIALAQTNSTVGDLCRNLRCILGMPPVYDVFDEARYVQPSDNQFPIDISGANTALNMCGGLAVINDVPKVLVYQLSRVANKRHNRAIPEHVFTKPPSAELRPDQKDTDTIPPSEVLDPVLRAYVEQYQSAQQAAPGLKVTTKAFGIGRRFPIAQRFYE